MRECLAPWWKSHFPKYQQSCALLESCAGGLQGGISVPPGVGLLSGMQLPLKAERSSRVCFFAIFSLKTIVPSLLFVVAAAVGACWAGSWSKKSLPAPRRRPSRIINENKKKTLRDFPGVVFSSTVMVSNGFISLNKKQTLWFVKHEFIIVKRQLVFNVHSLFRDECTAKSAVSAVFQQQGGFRVTFRRAAASCWWGRRGRLSSSR